jgi:intracellular multiplication protein IcmC
MGTSKFSTILFKALGCSLLLSSVFYSSLTFAANANGPPDAGTMLINIANQVPQLMRLVTAVAYVMGMSFIFSGIYKLKEYGEQRSMMSSQHDLKPAVILFVVGTSLLYLPSAVRTGLTSFWKNPNPYGYELVTTDQWSILYQDIFLVVQFIGTIAFIRGLVILSKVAHQGHQGEFGKGMTYIIAGILCINLYEFLNVINNTLGISGVLS